MRPSHLPSRVPARSAQAMVLLGVAVCAIVASLPGAARHAMWGDEVASARIVTEPRLGAVLRDIEHTESTPPLWYVTAWSLSKADAALTGGTITTPVERLRALSVAFAVAASVLTALWAVALLGDELLAAVAGVLVALGSTPASYAEQLRAYALVTFVSVAFGLVLVRASTRPSAWSLVGVALLAWTASMTHYFLFFTVVAGGVWLWTSRQSLPGRRASSIALGVGLAGFLPWLPRFLHQVHHGAYSWIGSFHAMSIVRLPGALFFGPQGPLFGVARTAATVCVTVGMFAIWRRPAGTAIVGFATLPVAGAGLLWASGRPIFDNRNLLVVAPYVAILAAASLLVLPRRLIRPVALATLGATILAAAVVHEDFGRPAYDRVAGGLIDLGWTRKDPIAIDVGGAKTSLRIAVAWYLPRHPKLVRARPDEEPCRTLFAIGESSAFDHWVARHRDHIAGVREFAWYDHPVLGRRTGSIRVVRLRGDLSLPGELFAVEGEVPCARTARHSA